ncbi:hypothetical protein T492DRAFT_1015742 [Pavlovales sp. CCMP2436]|nr:hypothetical protein T492DRAFT_1015742 [Pavlovales sp. CCMP2436]|mmetsp:Transcript_48098/g.112426  ORF Transcript_48098/g.112426 Transcript_48098/m.112426 type:complete len:165 (+) Transcript_48098:350-844(+)
MQQAPAARRALGESNSFAPGEVSSEEHAIAFKILRVATSPVVNGNGNGCFRLPGKPDSRRATPPVAFPQLFTPGGCPVDSEDVYEDFGTTYIDGQRAAKAKQPAEQKLRLRAGSVADSAAPPVTAGPQHPIAMRRPAPALGEVAEEVDEDSTFACMEPTQCTIC